MKTEKTFNVIWWNPNINQVEPYDVIPLFRREWFNGYFEKELVKDFETLKQWVKRCSLYHFGYKCEYEFLIGSWPFGSYKMKKSMNEFLSTNPNFDDYDVSNNFYNIITREMHKIDINMQILNNIDIVTEILFDEFLPDPKIFNLYGVFIVNIFIVYFTRGYVNVRYVDSYSVGREID